MKSLYLLLSILSFTKYCWTYNILSQQNCNLCLKTYKTNCIMCYNNCTQEFINCSLKICPDCFPNILFENNCLGTCCSSQVIDTTFNTVNVNKCIEIDSQTNNTINIQVTIGLIIGCLLIPFSLIGCIYLLLEHYKKEQRNNKKHIQVTNEDMKTMRSNHSLVKSETNNKEWETNGLIISGICPICNKQEINAVANCTHGFHYDCVANRIANDNDKCPLCKIPDSFSSLKVYCIKCHEYYQLYSSIKQILQAKSINTKNSFKCLKCQ